MWTKVDRDRHISSNSLTVDDYRLLMDSGWRRHGKQVYKTLNMKTCCPAYTIRCDTENFRISKTQKRVLNIVNNFLRKGEKPTKSEKSQNPPVMPIYSNSSLFSEGISVASSSVGDCLFDTSKYVIVPKPAKRVVSNDSGIAEKEDEIPIPGRSGSSRRKRWQALQDHMAERAQKTGVPYEEVLAAYLQRRKRRLEKNKPKEIEELLENEKNVENPAHFLDVRLCRSAPRSAEFIETLSEEYKLYCNYQFGVHNASPAKVNSEAFSQFLIESNLVNVHDFAMEAAGAPQFGSYHQQYWLDGKKLIGVGVVDLVPGVLSSVYFFYDPEYAFLQLGTYSALREIAFVRHLNRTYGPVVPAYADFTQYYLGYYIHSSPKMRYKAQFFPSYLACPQTYSWVPVEKCRPLLNRDNCNRLAEEGVKRSSSSMDSNDDPKIQLPFSKRTVSALRKGSFIVERDTIITTLSNAESLLSEQNLKLAREWISLVKNSGNVCIRCDD